MQKELSKVVYSLSSCGQKSFVQNAKQNILYSHLIKNILK